MTIGRDDRRDVAERCRARGRTRRKHDDGDRARRRSRRRVSVAAVSHGSAAGQHARSRRNRRTQRWARLRCAPPPWRPGSNRPPPCPPRRPRTRRGSGRRSGRCATSATVPPAASITAAANWVGATARSTWRTGSSGRGRASDHSPDAAVTAAAHRHSTAAISMARKNTGQPGSRATAALARQAPSTCASAAWRAARRGPRDGRRGRGAPGARAGARRASRP